MRTNNKTVIYYLLILSLMSCHSQKNLIIGQFTTLSGSYFLEHGLFYLQADVLNKRSGFIKYFDNKITDNMYKNGIICFDLPTLKYTKQFDSLEKYQKTTNYQHLLLELSQDTSNLVSLNRLWTYKKYDIHLEVVYLGMIRQYCPNINHYKQSGFITYHKRKIPTYLITKINYIKAE